MDIRLVNAAPLSVDIVAPVLSVTSDTALTASVIIAEYDADGRLLSVNMGEKTEIAPNAAQTLTASIQRSALSLDTAALCGFGGVFAIVKHNATLGANALTLAAASAFCAVD